MTDSPNDSPTDERPGGAPPRLPVAKAARSPLDYGALVLVAAATMLLVAGILYAFAVADARDVDGSERFRLLAQASSPFIAGLALAGIAIVVHERRRGGEQAQVAASATLGVGAMVSLLALLLALNGMVVDLTTDGVGSMFKLSNVIGRLATVALSGFALWLSAVTPLRRAPGPADRRL